MIRWKVYRVGGRMRTVTKLQILAAILAGFFLGYIFLPATVSFSDREELLLQGRFNAKPRGPGIQISPNGKDFVIEGKAKRILSGAIHYFRVVPGYWEDRLQKLLAAGLNTVETYVPWNAHEPSPGVFDFTGILDIHEYILTAQHLGLHVIVRPGPYICAEWEMGGLPAWLLHDPNMKLRSNYPPYTEAVTKYFTQLFQILVPLQSAYGGPIIGFQVENEYAEWTNDTRAGRAHLTFLHKLMRDLGALEVMFTSDGQNTLTDALLMKPSAHVIHTLNFQNANEHPLQVLKQREPHHPLMVMEFWTGWFDHWGEKHLERNISPEKFREEIHNILAEGASFNLYMFHGGTNFGFMNGGNWGKGEDGEGKTYRPTVSSYDYDAPLSEYGGVTQKYVELRNLLSEMVPDSMFRYPLPPLPSPVTTADYGSVKMTLYISLMSTLQYVPDPHTSDVPIPMEFLPLNHGSGQGYGYVLYRTFIPSSASLLTIHGLKDYGLVMLDLKPVKEVAHFNKITLSLPPATEGLSSRQLDILVENGGRVNFGHPLGVRKGISGTVEVDGKLHMDWKIYSFEFKSEFVQNIDSGGMWLRTPAADDVGPTLFKGSFTITDVPKDTFIDMKGWNKGIVFVNGANLGRYWMKGPTGSLYVPAPLLVRGINKVMVFEFSHPTSPPQTVTFMSSPTLDISSNNR